MSPQRKEKTMNNNILNNLRHENFQLVKTIEKTYLQLLKCNNFAWRGEPETQKLLCELRDALAEYFGVDSVEVQDHYGNLAIKQMREKQ